MMRLSVQHGALRPCVLRGVKRVFALVGGVCGVLLVFGVGGAFAAAVPGWSVGSFGYPNSFSEEANGECNETSSAGHASEGVCDTFTVSVADAGGAHTSHTPVVIEDVLPAGVSVANTQLLWYRVGGEEDVSGCTVVGLVVRCELKASLFSEHGPIEGEDTLKLWVNVTVNTGAVPGVLVNTARVSGGGAPEVSASSENTTLGGAPGVFGFSGFSAPVLGVGGTPEAQAGAHPYELRTQIDLNSVVREDAEGVVEATSVRDPRDVVVDLPPGVVGSALSAPACRLAQLSSRGEANEDGVSGCPTDSIIGHIQTYPRGLATIDAPLYNIVPERGVAAEFGFIDIAGGSHVIYASIAPTPQGYVVRSTSREVPQVALTQISANVYGDPAARDGGSQAPVPTFSNPSDCTGEPLQTTIYMDSWREPGPYSPDGTPDVEDPRWKQASYLSPAVTGCAALAGLFNPEIQAIPETTRADSPTGLEFNVKVPQSEGVETLATPPLKDTVVTLPEGMSVDPSSANGLGPEACSLAQIGMSATGLPNAAPPACPAASQIGTVELETPDLASVVCKQAGRALGECPAETERQPAPIEGEIYVATPYENPFSEPGHPTGSLLAIYIVVDDPRSGLIVKIPAKVEANPVTGQLTSTVDDTPQFPFSELHTRFFGGENASLLTPAGCGAYTATAELTPWSAPQSGPPATPTSAFQINQSATGEPCANPSPFAPALAAGTTDPEAAAFSPLSVTFSRQDTEQNLSGVAITTPPGLAGIIKNVVQCPEPGASTGECPPASEIGEATSAVGAGPNPYWVHGGKVYLTGPYDGGPFGLSILVPTTAGPYTLTGNGGPGREIVRSSIRVNPTTAQITTLSDPLPTILQGIPLDIKTVNVTLNHPGFIFNPTNCEPQTVTATFTSTQNETAPAATPFHTANCASLPFKPVLTATVTGHGSKTNGTTFTVKIQSPGLGQANIHKVDLTIPAKLPSRLTTIQKACPERTFNTNPASCDPGSIIGEATVHTPIFNNPLTGPAYLVSHGGAAFPDVEIVLQGENITIVLDGKTDIKNDITYSRFETAPDAPFTTFETTLPAGPHSALTPNVPENQHYNLCPTTLTMPTQITAQNGAETHQNTPIQITGCTLTITHHTIKNHTLTLTIQTPTPGKLTATAPNLTPTTTTTTTPNQTTTLKLHIHQHHKHTTTIHITLTPKTGPKQTTTLTTTL